MHSLGVAGEPCGRMSVKLNLPRCRKQGWWTETVAKAVGDKRKAGNMI